MVSLVSLLRHGEGIGEGEAFRLPSRCFGEAEAMRSALYFGKNYARILGNIKESVYIRTDQYFEDVDLGYRLGQKGWRNVFVPTATVEHEGGHSTRDHSAHMIAAHHDSARMWVARRYSGIRWWLIRTIITAGLHVRERAMTRRR
jgi:GT2 family glycosyltransferase